MKRRTITIQREAFTQLPKAARRSTTLDRVLREAASMNLDPYWHAASWNGRRWRESLATEMRRFGVQRAVAAWKRTIERDGKRRTVLVWMDEDLRRELLWCEVTRRTVLAAAPPKDWALAGFRQVTRSVRVAA